jgi:transcriptional regulator with XRE-family HTH domain
VARSLKVSSKYIEQVKLAMIRNGFLSQKDVADNLEIALSTVSRFLNGKSVSRENYTEICKLLALDWEQVRDLGCEVSIVLDDKLAKIIIFDYSLTKNPKLISHISSAFSDLEREIVLINNTQLWNRNDLNEAECLLLLVSSQSPSICQNLVETIRQAKQFQTASINKTFSILLVHAHSLMSLPLNHELHQELQGIEQLEWQPSDDASVLVQKIMDINTAEKRLENLKSFVPSLSQLEISKKWQLTYIGENQLQKLGALVADLKNSEERQIRSGYSYWGLGPAYMWERACTDRVGYHMHDNISNFPKIAKPLANFIDKERYNFVSLGVGEGSKDKVLISDFFCSIGETYPRDSFLYIPVDMSLDMLRISAEKTQDLLPHHRCIGIQRDIESYGSMAEIAQVTKLIGDGQPILYGFLGNTISNVESPEGVLRSIAHVMEPEDLLLFEVQMITELVLESQRSHETVRKEYLSGAFRRFVESALLQNTDLRINSIEMNNSYRVDVSLYQWESYGTSLLIDCFFENNTSQPLYLTLINGDTISIEVQEKIRLLRSRKFPMATLRNFVEASGFTILGENQYLNQEEGTGFGVMMLQRSI